MDNEKVLEAVREAISKSPERKFLESVELSINLRYIDLSDPKKRINEEILLPNGRGKPIKVAVFASGETALKAGKVADRVIMPEEIDSIVENKRKARKFANSYDYFLAEAPLMTKIGKVFGIFLGPRGKMARPIGVGTDPAALIQNLRKTVKARTKDRRTFQVPIGVKTMAPETLAQNIQEVLKKITAKMDNGEYNIETLYVKTTMGPAIKIEVR